MDTPCNNARVDPNDPPTQKESTTNNPDESNENTQRDRNAANSRAEEKIDSTSELSGRKIYEGSERPIYTRMHLRHLSVEILDTYKIDYLVETENPEYVLIKRWVPEYEQDFLWAATKALREKRELLARNPRGTQNPQTLHEPDELAVVEPIRAKRGSELDLKINRVPFEKWLEFKKGGKGGKHVLDVAMKPSGATKPVSGVNIFDGSGTINPSPPDTNGSSIPVRLAINSDHVLHELCKITNVFIFPHWNVIIPPWKPLVTYYDAIKERLQTLKSLNAERDSRRHGENRITSTTTSTKGVAKESPPNHQGKDGKRDVDTNNIPKPCEVCELEYPPHDTPLECLDIRINHFQCLVDFLDNDLKDIIELRRELALGTTREIAFENLWHLFNPGDLIVTPEPRRAYRVFYTSGGRPCLSTTNDFEKVTAMSPFRIECFYVDFDVKRIGPVQETIIIKAYTGKRLVTRLDADFVHQRRYNIASAYPVQFLDNRETTIVELIKRGKRLRQLQPFSHKRYEGPSTSVTRTYFVDDDGERRWHPAMPRERDVPNWFTSDIILDLEQDPNRTSVNIFRTILLDHRETAEGCTHYGPLHNLPEIGYRPECNCSDIVHDEIVDKHRAERYKDDLHLLSVRDYNDDITDDHLMLLPPNVTVFALKKQDWLTVSVDLIQDLDGDNGGSLEDLKKRSGLNDLVLPDGYIDLLEALIKTHCSPRTTTELEKRVHMDLIRGNGEGHKILLHGGAGLGKTSTAECIASYLRRPLYPITYGSFSSNPERVEQELAAHLSRAQYWNCIVLIDGAEFFISAKEALCGLQADLPPTVSAFCRAMDSYHGIIILTTNDASSVHKAVLSRIQVSLYYPSFDADSTTMVWRKHLDRMRASGLINLDSEAEKKILEFAKQEYADGKRWNGLQIRNYFQTAMAIAEHEATKHVGVAERGTKRKASTIDRPYLTAKMLKAVAAATGRLV